MSKIYLCKGSIRKLIGNSSGFRPKLSRYERSIYKYQVAPHRVVLKHPTILNAFYAKLNENNMIIIKWNFGSVK